MARLRRRIELVDAAAIDAQREHLALGSLLCTEIADLAVGVECELEIINPAGTALVAVAQVVLVGPSGTAFAFRDLAASSLASWLAEAATAGEPGEVEDAADGSTGGPTRKRTPTGREPANLHERMRGLSLVEQLKVARTGEVSERVLLERLYGKAVWEVLLRNQRLTQPEVAHLSRMGAMPRPLIELIVGNPAWLQSPQVRRALLGNPRLSLDQVERVLRLVPRNELRLIVSQTVYPLAVRGAAKKLLHGG